MDDNSSLVSVIIPTFNRKELLKETINAVLDQTYSNYELIVIDNYSTYDFFKLINEFGNNRIRAYQNNNNGIIAINRNFGIRKASGNYIAFCDDDDLWEKNKLEKQIDEMINRNAQFCFTGYKIIDSKNKGISIKNKLKPYQNKLTLSGFLFSFGYICNSSVVFERRIVSQIGYLDEDPLLKTVEDYEYYSRIFNKYKIIFISDPLLSYRIHNASNSRTSNFNLFKKQIYLHKKLLTNSQNKTPIIYAKYFKIYILFIINYFKTTFKVLHNIN